MIVIKKTMGNGSKIKDGWGLFQIYDDEWHIHPEDEPDHVHCKMDCGCKPRTDVVNGVDIIIHNSFDGREGVEQTNAILKSNQ